MVYKRLLFIKKPKKKKLKIISNKLNNHLSIQQSKYYKLQNKTTSKIHTKNIIKILSTITKMSMKHELPTKLLLEIFSNVGRQSPKFLSNIKIRYTNLNSHLMFVTFTWPPHFSLLTTIYHVQNCGTKYCSPIFSLFTKFILWSRAQF